MLLISTLQLPHSDMPTSNHPASLGATLSLTFYPLRHCNVILVHNKNTPFMGKLYQSYLRSFKKLPVFLILVSNSSISEISALHSSTGGKDLVFMQDQCC